MTPSPVDARMKARDPRPRRSARTWLAAAERADEALELRCQRHHVSRRKAVVARVAALAQLPWQELPCLDLEELAGPATDEAGELAVQAHGLVCAARARGDERVARVGSAELTREGSHRRRDARVPNRSDEDHALVGSD